MSGYVHKKPGFFMTRFCPSDSSLCAEPSAEFRPINVKKNQRRITEKKVAFARLTLMMP